MFKIRALNVSIYDTFTDISTFIDVPCLIGHINSRYEPGIIAGFCRFTSSANRWTNPQSLFKVYVILFAYNFVIVHSVTFESAQELFKIGFACDFAKSSTQNCVSTLRRSFQVSHITHFRALHLKRSS